MRRCNQRSRSKTFCRCEYYRIWMRAAVQDIAIHVARVESGANPADEPTRYVWKLLETLVAQFVELVLPVWYRE